MPLLIIAAVIVMLLCGVALAFVTGAGITLAYLMSDYSRYLIIAPQRMFAYMDVFALMAMPLFIWAGEIMNRSGITRSLVDFAMLLMGRFRGGLGHVNVMTSVFFSGISGSAAADVAALCGTLVPQMEKRGYDKIYAGAITAAASVIGPIIPPSIVMILYGSIMSTDVAAMFAGGIVPGLLIALALMALNAVIARRENHPGGKIEDIPPFWPTIKNGLPALSLPFIILGSIVFGITTPIEAGALAITAAVLIGAINRKLGMQAILDATRSTVILTGSIFMILIAGSLIAYLVALTQVSDHIAYAVNHVGVTGQAYLFILMVVFLICGMFIDIMLALTLIAPILVPEALSQGFHPVHVGILICVNLTMGLITPPMGGSIMMVSLITGSSYWALIKRLMPFVVVELLVLLAMMLAPELTLYLPRVLGLL